MKQTAFLFSCLFVLLSFKVAAHDYHASITDVNFNPKTQHLEVAMKVFMDDLEVALPRKNNSKIAYNRTDKVQQYLRTYVQEHLRFEQVKGKPLPHKFVGSEEETEAVWVYVEVPVQGDVLPQLFVYNTVLMELFNDQMNIVNINYKGKTNSMLFQKSDTAKKFTF